MPVVAWITVIVSLVLLVAVAIYLARVVLILRHATDTLGKVLFGVGAIAHRLEPVNDLVGAVNDDLDAVAGALEGVVAKVSAPKDAHDVA